MIDNDERLVSRADAIAAGIGYYFTGKPCKRGHIASRNTKTRACVDCNRQRWLEASKRKRANPVYRATERERNRLKAAMLRATDKAYVAAKNESNRIYANNKRNSDPEHAADLNRKARERWATNEDFRERNKEYVRGWLSQNPEKKRAHQNKRRALEIGAEGWFSGDDVLEINERQGFVCTYCGISTETDYEIDHIQPLSRGGTNWPENIQILCKPCNSRKRTRNHDEYVAMLANDNTKKAEAA